jgi:hypothetical protein
MSDFHEDCKRQLLAAAETLFGPPAASPPAASPPAASPARRAPTTRRVPLIAAIVLGALLLAAAAFAATQIIGVGAPVSASHRQQRPSRSTGVGVPVPGVGGRPASVRLLAISVPDPAGGLPWGMRIVRTTRGLVCVQVGRLLDGRLGVLGQDGQFDDDGLFHELPADVLDPDTCSQPADYDLYTSEGLPASGALPGPVRSCLYPGAPRLRPSEPQPCPAGDERMIAFGVLGPHAVSVSYRVQGAVRTVATTGDLGAYLVVLRQPPIRFSALELGPARRRITPAMALERFPSLGSSSSLLGRFPIEPQSSLVSTLTFRFARRVCRTGAQAGASELPECTSSIARTPRFVPFIPPGLHAAISVEARKVAGGYDLELAFIAPAAVFDASTAYGVQITMPDAPACGRGGVSGQSIERDVARGQSVHVTELVGQPPGCHGVVHGRVVFGRQPDAFTGPVSGETIGRFSFDLP